MTPGFEEPVDPDHLRAVPIFSALEERHLRALASHAEPVLVAAGDWVFQAGDSGDALYVLRSGRVEVVAGDGAVIRVLSRGSVLGELAVLTGSARSAGARARRDCELLRVSREEFAEVLRDSSGFAIGLTRALGSQLQASRAIAVESRPQPGVITIVDATGDLDGDNFAGRLLAELGRHGRAIRLPLRPGEAPSDGHAALLDAAERAHDQVVLVAGALGESDWARFCVRQADRVLALGDIGRSPPASGLDRGCDLVVVGGPGTRAQLEPWITRLDPRAVHRVGEGEPGGVGRLARRLAGRSLGIVLSGGGARGFAHIGVLEELDAAGVVVDRVGGCSMGAFVGGLYAMGREPEDIARCGRAEFVERNPLGDYTLPMIALVRGRRAEAMMRRTFGESAIEEMEREFFCVSSDMLGSELVVHRRGQARRVVGASMCLPGILPPVSADGRLLVDGGVFNSLPVEQMAATGEGPVLAVDVTASFVVPGRREPRPRADRALSALHRFVTGVEEPRPRLKETIIRSIVLGSINTAEAASRYATWTITPHVDGFGMLAFDRIDAIREAGREAARELLARTDLPTSR